MKRNKYISIIFSLLIVSVTLSSCAKDEFTETIFPDTGTELDPNSYSYKFDKWLQNSYLGVYNLEFRYKMQDVGADMNYNLVPAEFDKSEQLAVLTKYLWFDVYSKIAGPDFLKMYGPRIIHLIGSPAYNPQSGTMILGLAEGGIKVTLFRVNDINTSDIEAMNEFYFKTMHHEFAHILHQTKSYPKEFNLLSTGHYDSSNWQDRQEGVVNSLGFITPYASSETREDFAETIANYIVKTDADWEHILDYASRGWETKNSDDLEAVYYCWYYYINNEVSVDSKQYAVDNQITTSVDDKGQKSYVLTGKKDSKGNPIVVYPVEDKDKVDGVAIINQKINIARNWFKEAWGVDLDAIRKEVQYRQQNIDMKALIDEINNIQ